MNRTQVADAFASQSKPRARASALYFDGPIAFSYGEHFPLAVITAPKAATVNTDKYSSTTSRHQSMIRRALREAGYDIAEAATSTMRELAAKVRA